MAWVPLMGEITVLSVYFYHTEEWTERNQQLLEATGRGEAREEAHRDGSSRKLRPRSRTTGLGWPGTRGGGEC